MNTDFKGTRCVVTGGAGVIGRELLSILHEAEGSVLSIDKNPLPTDFNTTHIVKDLATDSIDEINDFRPEIFFHLAAAFERSKESPEFWGVNWKDNTMLSHRMVDAASSLDSLRVFIFASSYLIYSPALYMSDSLRHDPVYLKEDSAVSPRNVTGASKYYTEKELGFIKEYLRPDLRTVSARIYRVYGKGSRDVISRWIRSALSNDQLDVYNKDNRFDYIYARDVAEGLFRLALAEGVAGVVNLGSGQSHSVGDVINTLSSFTNIKIIDHGRTEVYENSTADIGLLKNLTKWQPPTTLSDGIRHIFEYERESSQAAT
ncbi:NAD-dependent epimerase/dehydratase family protein [Candidatus Magnetominusculus xianensis]|uniref:NAD-dependent epimerase/dehydratase n=1 Tax=Candidatus Magnetominusculus xianensis TaxID=1748249 RepID=A0ABR5SKZ9_9BACT|nr:NAD(P)-dependent oxidoreductase [Candidatus Magnetominusculus xianensis]KWT93410.1 NAD-dependent epimerase/dehydratase [Candidatus Magnetominusculus xianensis]MBF0404776.1 NAD(P)-dependent oxidoreductase [Nitrospirota bacterium]